ncbi:MAG: T9SS type A sorting domain-containing protein [Paludibacteraceae bacterium]
MNVHGSIAHCYVTGVGANRKLYTFDEDYIDATATSAGNLLQYNIGELATPWDVAPSAVVYNDIINGNLQQNGNSCISPDGRGGWWISQNRATDAATIPSLIHIKSDGTLDFNSGKMPTLIASSAAGGMALNYEGTQIAMGCGNEVKVYDIKYTEDGTPTLTQLYSIKPAAGANTSAVSYDRAGNIYVAAYNATGTPAKVGVFALPKAANSFTTLAPSTLKMVITDTKDIVKDNNILFYPNPVVDRITVKSKTANIEEISIFDINGKLMYKHTANQQLQDINVNFLNSGVYILNVKTKTETNNAKFIKK